MGCDSDGNPDIDGKDSDSEFSGFTGMDLEEADELNEEDVGTGKQAAVEVVTEEKEEGISAL